MNKEKIMARRHDRASTADVLGANTEIGRKLRQYYDGLLSEEVPDRFAALLEQLDQVESARKPE